MRLDIRLLQPGHEGGIETGQAIAVMEIVEAQPMSEREGERRRVHRRNIQFARGVIRSCANRLDKPAGQRKAARVRDINADDGAVGFTHGPARMQPASVSVRNWLAVVAAMIFLMIVLGALTRLTESGLSMVEWKPVTGWLPPLGDQAWQAELQKYLSSPQGRLVNRGFDGGRIQADLLARIPAPSVGSADRRRGRPAARCGSGCADSSHRGSSRDCLPCWSWAACKARWAGRWLPRAWSTAPRSANTGSPPICCWRSSSMAIRSGWCSSSARRRAATIPGSAARRPG